MTSNPMLNSRVLEDVLESEKPMTVQGAINKTIILVGIVILSGVYTWNLCATGFADKATMFTMAGVIAGFILALITSFRPQSSNITAPMYALCEGLAIGSISYAYNSLYDGIVVNAFSITILTLLGMLFLYSNKIIRATEKFRRTIYIATIGIFLFYLVGFIGALLGHPMTIFNGSLVGIGVSLAICVIAAFNFILDFDFIEQATENHAPSYFEWYGGFGLLVTLVWLYLEILRLLAQLSNRK